MKARGIKVLAHALPRTWGQPCGVRKSALWSYDSRASGGSLYPHTAGGRGKYGGTIYTVNSHLIINFRDTGKISSEVNALNEIYPAHAAENLNNSAGTIKHRIGNTTYIVERVFSGKLTPRQIVVEEIVSNAKMSTIFDHSSRPVV